MSNIRVTHELLARLAERTCAEIPSEGIVFFGLRGALPMDISGTSFAPAHDIRLTDFDHLHMRCTIGQWRPGSREIALFPGSTVPHRKALAGMLAGGALANMLMLGRYAYNRGMHNGDSPNGHRAFRQAIFFPVWRTRDDVDFDSSDRIDLGSGPAHFVWDNLHCAYQDNLDHPSFSSNGCQVVAGRPKSQALQNRPETGPWARFIEHSYGSAAQGQARFTYLLFSGAEAAMAQARPEGPLTRSLRFGSSGPWVERVQHALREEGYDFLEPDSRFGRDTLRCVMAFQERQFGAADGIVGPNTAAALKVEWSASRVASSVPGAATSPSAAPASPAAPPPAPASGEVPEDWHRSAAQITPGFEVAGDPYLGVTGDFDRMGISCGALQWNIGSGSLQPMVKEVGRDLVLSHMPGFGAELWSACNDPIPQGLSIVRSWQSGTKLSPQARAELRALMGSVSMRAQQDVKIAAVASRALKMAAAWAIEGGTGAPSKREFLWFFDLATQNGSLEGVTRARVRDFISLNGTTRADDVICDFLASLSGTSGHIKDANRNAALWRDKAAGEKLDLLVLSYLRSGSALPKWRHVVLNRKGTIAMGEGWVNGSKRDLSSHGI